MTASAIIDDLGGTTAVATALNTPISTVHQWRRSNQIPAWRQASILALALEKQVALSATDFPSRDERVSLRKAAA